MPLGIKATVDFAFKKIFGSPRNSLALIGLLNAILSFERPIVKVRILNPFSYKEFAKRKLIVLDVRCRDSDGRWLNVEMQITVQAGLLERLAYYACSMYVDQIEAGQNYALANPAISICLLNQRLFPDTQQAHHRFRMIDLESGRELSNAIEVHTVELTKYNLDEATISRASKLEQWVFLLLNAHRFDSKRLKQLLPHREFHQAIHTLEIIAGKTKDRKMYDQRERELRDYEWTLASVREEAHRLGLEEGRHQGIEQGRELGIEQGREQGLRKGRHEGALIGKIQLLQELLGDSPLDDEASRGMSSAELAALLAALQERMRSRDA